MSLDIKHPRKPTEIDKINDDDYMESHLYTGTVETDELPSSLQDLLTVLSGKTFQLPQLIELKTLSADSGPIVFSNLNGNSYTKLLLIGHLSIGSYSSDPVLSIKPNNDNGNNYANSQGGYSTGGAWFTNDSTNSMLTHGYANKVSQTFFECELYPVSGVNRYIKSVFNILGGNSGAKKTATNLIEWKNSADNITSLNLLLNYSSVTGYISLYDIVDVEI